MKNLLLIILALLFLYSCNNESKIKNDFMNKVWVIDSIKSKEIDNKFGINYSSLRSFSNILKPINDSVFDIYQDQDCYFDSFTISNDTIYLVIHKTGKKVPFRFEKVNEYTSKLVSLDDNIDWYKYYITDLTDLFSDRVENNSKLYNQIKDYAWYPIKVYQNNEKIIDEENPDYYIKERAIQISGDSIKSSVFFGKNNLIKMTDKGIYVFNPQEKRLESVYGVNIKSNRLQLYENDLQSLIIDLKKIESTMLIDTKNLPKKVRLDCSEIHARHFLTENINVNSNSRFHFDKNSIELIDANEEECVYKYVAIYQSKEFEEIYSFKTLKVTFTEDGKLNLKVIQ